MRRLFEFCRAPLPALAAACCAASAAAQEPPSRTVPDDEVVVTAAFREASVADLPLSVTVLERADLQASTLQHFEETIRRVPNLNLSGEGSRSRYFQLRGVGELEQYEGSPNPSIGFIVDDIDFSGLGSIGTLFDIERVEVLRGPQGTRYGANALGGLIYLASVEPGTTFSSDSEITAGSDDTLAVGVAAGGPLGDGLRGRASLQHYEGSGFRDNVYLGRDDTYGRDELTARGKISWDAGERVSVDFAGLYVDIDNGYDAWAVDNGFVTYSDKPGQDTQRSAAGSIRVTAELDRVDLVSITGAADTDAVFSFDADWGNDDYWAPYLYDYFQSFDRERNTRQQELRVLSKPGALGGRGQWLAGVYALDLDESNAERVAAADGVFCDPMDPCVFDDTATSDYGATNLALFGQVDLALTARLALTAGFRFEQRNADYADSAGASFAPDDDMRGGELALTWDLDAGRSAYVKIARGYKAGGFNVSLAGQDFDAIDGLTENEIEFGPESMTILEAGFRVAAPGRAWTADLNAFVARREDQQIEVPLQLVIGDPTSFSFVTANAERGTLQGVEAGVDWQPAERWQIGATLGLLDAEVARFALFPSIEGRTPAHAPRYTYSAAATYRTGSGWFGRVDVGGMDGFYFDYGHDAQASGYNVVDVRAGRDWGRWSATLWVRNAFDAEYAVRGFYFGNVPPDFPAERYLRLGDPRHFGVTLRYGF